MSEDVLELCQDGHESYESGEQFDPEVPANSDSRVMRSGSCVGHQEGCHSVYYGTTGCTVSSDGNHRFKVQPRWQLYVHSVVKLASSLNPLAIKQLRNKNTKNDGMNRDFRKRIFLKMT